MCPSYRKNENARLPAQNRMRNGGFFFSYRFLLLLLFPTLSLLPSVFHLLVHVTMPRALEYLQGERSWRVPEVGGRVG